MAAPRAGTDEVPRGAGAMILNDSPKEMAYLDRAGLWARLVGFCEELERDENEAEVGRPGIDPVVLQRDFADPGGEPAQKKAQKKPKRLPAWLHNASAAVVRDYLKGQERHE